MNNTVRLLMDFYRWLEAQDALWVGHTDMDDGAVLRHLVEQYLTGVRVAQLP